MESRSIFRSNQGITMLETVLVIIILLIVTVIMFPIVFRERDPARKSVCQFNMKELVVALHMYWTDYDTTLPSSALHRPRGAKTWDALASAEFCAELGPVPPPDKPKPAVVHWVQLLYSRIKDKDAIWCPSDVNRPHSKGRLRLVKVTPGPKVLVSYIYRPAVDRAWFGSMCTVDPAEPTKKLQMKCFRKEGDFEFVTDQMVFFERLGYHWGDEKNGWRDNVSLNAAFLDGHVRNVRLSNAVNKPTPKNSAELARYLLIGGEPMYYNYLIDPVHPTDPATNKYVKGQFYDSWLCYDNLR